MLNLYAMSFVPLCLESIPAVRDRKQCCQWEETPEVTCPVTTVSVSTTRNDKCRSSEWFYFYTPDCDSAAAIVLVF